MIGAPVRLGGATFEAGALHNLKLTELGFSKVDFRGYYR